MKKKLNVYIGYDSRQDVTPEYSKLKNSPYEVCKKSIEYYSSEASNIETRPLKISELIEKNIYTRPVDKLASTEFTYSRFLTPYLNNYEGLALFCDSDFVWLTDITEILNFYDEKYAVMCVQHDYTPKADIKMDGYKQTVYPRKNWSSLMLFNCAHPDCKNLSLDAVNNQSPKYLHRMEWTTDENIGSIPLVYNWLEGEYDSDVIPQAIHFTNGGPWYKDWDGDYSRYWIKMYEML